ncbi:dual specificity protein kinase TTK-like [Littorina saxatilis]|uniref:dual specificity protein kinase TTK-like n=1 Tax=Littorina saxatilis TaxID=31220 RepID=UPI0038B4B759
MSSDSTLSLQTIRAKLQQLQMLQQQGSATSNNNSLSTPSSALRTAELTDRSTANSLHFTDRSKVTTESHHAHPIAAPAQKHVLLSKGPAKRRHDLMTGSSAKPTGSVLIKTDDLNMLMEQNSSGDFHLTDSVKLTGDLHHPHHAATANPILQQCLNSQSHLQVPPRRINTLAGGLRSSTQPSGAFQDRTAELTDKSILNSQATVENTTTTFEVGDHKARMRNIETEGNCPAEWKSYIDFLKSVSSEGDIRSKPLSDAYNRAFTGILNSRDHRNEAAVRLIMDYVNFCSERFEWDTVDTILDMARSHIQGFAIITVACAEVKIFKGDHEKAMSILTKALAKGKAQPKELVIRAIKSAEAGQSKLISEQERKLEVPWVLGKQSSQDTCTEEFKIPQPAYGYTDSQTEMATDSGNTSTDFPLLTHPSSTSKQPPLRHYYSTPEVRSSAIKTPWSQLQSSKLKGIGKPMRVRNSMQHPVHMLSKEKEDDTDFINSIIPFRKAVTITTEHANLGHSVSGGHREPLQSTGHPTADHSVFDEHDNGKKTSVPSLPPPVPTAAAPAARAAPGMSTPSCKPLQVQPAVMQTPSGEPMQTVTVNGEQYCILKKVGRGGSAQVYMVLDANTNIRALKVVDLEGAGLEVIDGFRNEISLLQRLQYCDSVIKMYNFELNEELNRLYVVLEFGETDLSGFFSERAKQQQGLDPTLIKFYWAEMLRAVNALHKEGIIHSDLKPANFMLVAGNLKLIDFGIANALQQNKTSVLKDSRVGTPSYMSPEAIMAACDDTGDDSADDNKENDSRPKYKIGVRSDVWSLGCILYNMVYSKTPFQHFKNNMGKLQAITNPACTIKFPHIPDPHLMDVLQKCLTREVKLRPTSEELLSHPYLKKDKDNKNCYTPPQQTSKGSVACSSAISDMAAAAQPVETSRLQELKSCFGLFKSHLVQGSPRTANAVNRVMDLLQQLESGKQ